MKRIFFILLSLLLLAGCAATKKDPYNMADDMEAAAQTGADAKLSALSALGAAPDTDAVIYIVQDSTSNKVTVANFLSELKHNLDTNGYTIVSSGSDDVTFQLPDNAGARSIIIKDSDGTTVLEINSDGVINPGDGSSAYDNFIADDTTCSNDVAGKILVTPIVGNLGDTTFVLQACIGGSLTTVATFDGSVPEWTFTHTIDSSAGIEATIINAGIKHYILTGADLDLQTDDPNIAFLYLSESATSDEDLTLAQYPLVEGTSGQAKLLYFLNIDSTYSLNVTPDGTDAIQLDGVSCGAGKALLLENEGDWVILSASDSDTFWLVIANSAGVSCEI